MKTIKCIFFCFSVLLFAQDQSVEVMLKYYPLHVGDYWQYKVSRTEGLPDSTWIGYKEVIGDTLMPNGKRYYQVKEDMLPIRPYFKPRYIRIDTNNINIYEYFYNDYEFLVDSLLAQKGDRFGECHVLTQDTINEYFGLDVNTRRVDFSCTIAGGYMDGWELAEGLGEVMRYLDDTNIAWIHYQCDLIYAKISNIEYGIKAILNETTISVCDFELSQNYPNPFNPTTTISYELTQPGTIELSVFDIHGKKIADLVNKYQLADKYQVSFNGENLSSGVYTYRLISAKDFKVHKMLLLK